MEILTDLGLNINRLDEQAIQLFLRYLAEKTILPELHLVFGNRILELILLFSGATIEIPTLTQIKQKLIDIDIYTTMQQDRNKDQLFSELKKRYNIPKFEIQRRYESVREWLDNSVIRQYSQSGTKT